MEIYTIGFTKTSAEHFFGRLNDASVKRLLDVRLNNTSQLSGFAKARDLKYFLQELSSIEYVHTPQLAPTQEILDSFKKERGDWFEYETSFKRLMEERHVLDEFSPAYFNTRTALLCSEATAKHCHRRLVVEMFENNWPEVKVIHL